jgi:hypothetical protein
MMNQIYTITVEHGLKENIVGGKRVSGRQLKHMEGLGAIGKKNK